MRNLINPIIIRRSRIDLKEIEEYAEDLKKQNIEFPEVIGPELIEYNLGEIQDLYLLTLDQISNKFTSACYNLYEYLVNIDLFNEKYIFLFKKNKIVPQTKNFTEIIKRLLVMRFESSKNAFKSTLKTLLLAHENIKKNWEKGYVEMKNVDINDLDDIYHNDIVQKTLMIDEIDCEENFKEDYFYDKNKTSFFFKKEHFKDKYIQDIEENINLLKTIEQNWFSNNENKDDPKLNEVSKKINYLLNENKNRKIVIFTMYADTAKYVFNKLKLDGYKILLCTSQSCKSDKINVRLNFDASISDNEQKNDFDILVTTDALSEGFNLNRAVNYDIPYNPTRIVQRIGRINRVNKKLFDRIFIYNLFPTIIGEQNISIKSISTLKMLLINNVIGNDTKTLTPDEDLQSYFKSQYEKVSKDQNKKSFDVNYRNIFNSIKHNDKLMEEVCKIPERTKIVRFNKINKCSISFIKKGNNYLFAILFPNESVKIIPVDLALKYFKADVEEKSYPYDDDFNEKFITLREEIEKEQISETIIHNKKNKKQKTIDVLEKLVQFCPDEKTYLNDLIEIIREYNDLSDAEMKFIRDCDFKIEKLNAFNVIQDIKEEIPIHYIFQIKERVKNITSQTDTIMFVEDLRN